MQGCAPTAQDQVASMLSNGIRFEHMSCEEAIVFLTERNFFFKVKAFDKNFDKYIKETDPRYGKYVDLDFAYLADLSRKDALLREAILDLALDLEHYLKVTVNRVIMEAQIPTQSIMHDFFEFSRNRAYFQMRSKIQRSDAAEKASVIIEHAKALSESCKSGTDDDVVVQSAKIHDAACDLSFGIDPDHIEKSIAFLNASFYSRKLVEKYGDLTTMEPWHFMEMASFGDFISFYKFIIFDSAEKEIIERRPGSRQDATTAKFIKNLLFPTKTLRNAAAHNDCLLNSLKERMHRPVKKIRDLLIGPYGLGTTEVNRSWQTPVVHDLAALLISYDRVVPFGETKQRAGHTLNQIQIVMKNNTSFYLSQEEVKNALALIGNMAACFSNKYLTAPQEESIES